MKFLKFLGSKFFLKNVGLAIVFTMVIVFLALLFLKIYTRHGRSLPVPDFRGSTLKEAHMLADASHLRIVITDSIYNLSKPRGTVLDQNPDPSFRVKKNRTIHLVMNALVPEKVTFDKEHNIESLSFREAKNILEMKGLKVGEISYVSSRFPNTVVEYKYQGKKLKIGDEVDKGSKIDLVLATGYSYEVTKVPDLIGLSIEDAENKISEAYMNVGVVEYDDCEDSKDSAQAFVYKQMLPAEREITRGTSLDLILTIDSLKLPQPDTTKSK